MRQMKSATPALGDAPAMRFEPRLASTATRISARPKSISLNALLCFEASARHLSFTKAADEIGVSVFAVSHHVRQIERRLGQPLFIRSWRSLALTDLGKMVLPLLENGFGTIFTAIEILQNARRPNPPHAGRN
jgi:DNA-binding transcriptional LysR family regulator